jgi:hypothetical protein
MQERQESGLSIRAFCEKAGFHENIYFYWQRKLREAACVELSKNQSATTGLATTGFAEVKLTGQYEPMSPEVGWQNQICVDVAGVRITAGGEYPTDKLAVVLREVMRPC